VVVGALATCAVTVAVLAASPHQELATPFAPRPAPPAEPVKPRQAVAAEPERAVAIASPQPVKADPEPATEPAAPKPADPVKPAAAPRDTKRIALVIPEKASPDKPVRATAALIKVVVPAPLALQVNGKPASGAPAQLRLAPGATRLQLVDVAGKLVRNETVQLAAGDNGTRRPDLPYGTVEFNAPAGTTVTLSGRVLGRAPFGARAVLSGKHQVRFQNETIGRDTTSEVSVSAGDYLVLDVK
jgi:hypothetical protein